MAVSGGRPPAGSGRHQETFGSSSHPFFCRRPQRRCSFDRLRAGSAPIFNVSLNMLRYHQILRPNKSSHNFFAVLFYQSNQLFLKGDSTILIFFRLLASHLLLRSTIRMPLVLIRMKVLSEKRMEFSQAVVSLIGCWVRFGVDGWDGI